MKMKIQQVEKDIQRILSYIYPYIELERVLDRKNKIILLKVKQDIYFDTDATVMLHKNKRHIIINNLVYGVNDVSEATPLTSFVVNDLPLTFNFLMSIIINNMQSLLTSKENQEIDDILERLTDNLKNGVVNHIDYVKILQGRAINAMVGVRTHGIAEIDFTGKAEIQVDENFKLTIKDYVNLKKGLTPAVWQVFDCFMIWFTAQAKKDVRIRLPLKEFMLLRGLKDEKTARQQVKEAMEALKLIEYTAREKIKGKWVDSGSISIYGGTGYIKNGIIHFNFNVDFYNTIINYTVMDYSKETLKLNTKIYPHALYFSKYLDVNYRLNEGKERANIITVQTLINKAPTLPTYEEIMKGDRHYYKRLVEPVINNLDIIERLYYDFIDKDGHIIKDPLTYFKGEGGYSRFINSKIKVDYSDYPKHPQRAKNRKEHQKV